MAYDLLLTDGDISFGPDGNPVTVTNNDKLKQEISKILLTPIGADPGDLQYGSQLRDVLGRPVDFNVTQTLVAKAVAESLKYLQSLQLVQSTKQTFNFPEVIGSVDAISVSQPSLSQVSVQVAITSVQGLRTIYSVGLGSQ